jgi:tetratricopeptide (TPR) repeat protein
VRPERPERPERPDWAERPNRPDWASRPSPGRPGINLNNRQNINNQYASNMTSNVNNVTNVNNTQLNVVNNRNSLVNRQYAGVVNNTRFGGTIPPLRSNLPGRTGGGWGANGVWYGHYSNLHTDWYHGSWSSWRYRPAGSFAAGAAFGWLLAPGRRVVYRNPYYLAPVALTAISQYVNYSQPIPVPAAQEAQAPTELPVEANAAPADVPDSPTPSAAAPPRGAADEDPQGARDLFDQAVASFKKGDYADAQSTVERAIELLPGDAMLHELRALTLFAQTQYREAAAAQYAVLAAGPGWDWETLRSFYPNVNVYTRQLRMLERYQKNHPRRGDASFLLACHYLTLGANDAAIKQLEHTAAVQPEDQVSARLLDVLKQPPDAADRPIPGA